MRARAARRRTLLWASSAVLLLPTARALAAASPSPGLPAAVPVRGVWTAEGPKNAAAAGRGARRDGAEPVRGVDVDEVVAAGNVRIEDFVAGPGLGVENARLGAEFVQPATHGKVLEAAKSRGTDARVDERAIQEERALRLRQAERIRRVEDFLVELLPICNIFHLVTSTFGIVSAAPRTPAARTLCAPRCVRPMCGQHAGTGSAGKRAHVCVRSRARSACGNPWRRYRVHQHTHTHTHTHTQAVILTKRPLSASSGSGRKRDPRNTPAARAATARTPPRDAPPSARAGSGPGDAVGLRSIGSAWWEATLARLRTFACALPPPVHVVCLLCKACTLFQEIFLLLLCQGAHGAPVYVCACEHCQCTFILFFNCHVCACVCMPVPT